MVAGSRCKVRRKVCANPFVKSSQRHDAALKSKHAAVFDGVAEQSLAQGQRNRSASSNHKPGCASTWPRRVNRRKNSVARGGRHAAGGGAGAGPGGRGGSRKAKF